MYTEGMADLNEMIMMLPLCPPNEKDAKIAMIKERITTRYFPAFEKVSGPFSIWGHWDARTKKSRSWASWGFALHFPWALMSTNVASHSLGF